MNKGVFLTAILVTLSAFCPSALAQEHGPPAGGSDKNLKEAASDIKGRSVEMERVSRDAKKDKTEKRDNPPAASFDEIKEDFERIQLINNDVLQTKASSAAPDFERISESAAEIEKRAIRLKANLFGPPSKKQSKEPKAAIEAQELKELLTLLDNSITSFTHSPIFQNTKVITPDDSLAAQKELDRVIKISTTIKNEADRLKANSPPR